MDAPPVNREDMRACIRARLVALAEEVKMISQQKPTEAQLRQHALDRALTDGMVGAVHSSLMMTSQSKVGELMEFADPATLAKAVTEVADVFVAYLRGPAEEPAFTVTNTPDEHYGEETLAHVYEALNEAGVGGEQATDAVNQMQNRGILFRAREAADLMQRAYREANKSATDLSEAAKGMTIPGANA
jgi:hypothetical protein